MQLGDVQLTLSSDSVPVFCMLLFLFVKLNFRTAPTLVYNVESCAGKKPNGQPIRVAPKRRGSKGRRPAKRKKFSYLSPLFDDHGFPHPQDEWETLLPEVKAGRLIRKRLHTPPKLHGIDPAFGVEFDEMKHGQMLKDELKISHLTSAQQFILTALIKRY